MACSCNPSGEPLLQLYANKWCCSTAMADCNYCSFFKLYKQAPNMGAFLMDVCVGNIRTVATAIMMKCMKPHVPLAFMVSRPPARSLLPRPCRL